MADELLPLSENKRCPCCGNVLPPIAFGRNKTTKDGLSSYCRSCMRDKQKQWKINNKEKVRGWKRAWKRYGTQRGVEV